MRWLAVLPLLCIVAPVSAQDSDAEKLYRAMEKKVRGAKTLQVVFAGDVDSPFFKGTLKGTISWAQGNKARLEMEADLNGKAEKMLMITDGKVSYEKEGDKVKIEPKPKKVEQFDKMFPSMMGRTGLSGGFLLGGPDSDDKKEPFDLDKKMPIKNFKLGAKEKIGDRNAQVVDYQIDVSGKTAKASVWIDTQTQLPLKRVLVVEEKGQTMRVTETYATFTVDGKLDAKLFDIPAK